MHRMLSPLLTFPPLANNSCAGDNVLSANSQKGQSDEPFAAARLGTAVESGAIGRTV